MGFRLSEPEKNYLWELFSKGGVQKKKKKSREFSLSPSPPPPPPSKVGNLIMIFFQHSRVKLGLFIDAIHDIWNQGKRGTRVFILNIFQRIIEYLRAHKKAESESILLYILLQNKK